jgi:hypothetical protein
MFCTFTYRSQAISTRLSSSRSLRTANFDDARKDLGETREVTGIVFVELVGDELDGIGSDGVHHGMRPADRHRRTDGAGPLRSR